MSNKLFIPLLLAVATTWFSCKKFVEVDPPKNEIVLSEAFKEDASATSAILGIYINMLADRSLINGGITVYSALAADETEDLTNTADNLQFQQNELAPVNGTISSMWSAAYQNLVLINACIEGLEQSNTLTPAVKAQLLGECHFNRAFINFYLVNLWGPVPLITTSNYKQNSVLAKSSEENVYNSIITDLTQAQTLLTADYPTAEKVRPNKWTATALLARAYLYHKEYANAATAATAVIESGMYGPLPDLNSAFLKGSTEAIWQLMPSRNIVLTTEESLAFIGDIPYGYGPNYSLRTGLLASFEANDGRKTAWINTVDYQSKTYYYPYKYKDKGDYNAPDASEYYIMFRLAEQYMIRAEARAQLKQFTDAAADIDVIRNRAGLGAIEDILPALDLSHLLTAINNENRHEFFTEWGHRWLDLKRTGDANTVLTALKPTWKATDALFPFPQTEVELNKNLIQNDGYK